MVLWGFLLVLPGALFVMRYSPRAGVSPFLAVSAYALFFAALVWVSRALVRRSDAGGESGTRPVLPRLPLLPLFLGFALFLAALVVIYMRIEPEALQIDRWSALDHFWNALSRGEYPYHSRSHLGSFISGFPGLFVLALPFWLLGDVGLLQFASLAAFFWLSICVFRRAGRVAFLLALLAGTPVFAYEMIVRSDLFSNMVVIAWVLYLTGKVVRSGDCGIWRLAGLAAVWGLLLSTRGVVIIPLTLAGFSLVRGRGLGRGALFGAMAAVFFAATLIPFYLWDPVFFADKNPYFVQSGYIPGWALAIVLLTTAGIGWSGRSATQLFAATGLLLFATVFGCFLLAVVRTGFVHVLWENGFDISYFALPMPFLLLEAGGVFFGTPTRDGASFAPVTD